MKKILSVILCLIIVLSSFSFAFAASVSSYASAKSAKRGDTVTVYVNVQSSPAIKGMSVSVKYDKNVFEYVSYKWNAANLSQQSFKPSDGNGVVLMSADTMPAGNVFAITLKVKSGAALGNSYVGFSFKLGSDSAPVSIGTNVNITCSHTYGAWTKDFAASCTTNGQESRKCTICGAKETRAVAAFGHSFSAWETSKEASCTEAGEKQRTCKTCGFVDKVAVKALGHVLGDDAEITLEATCTTHGKAKGICTRCKEEAEVETAFAPHTWGVWSDTKASTCTASGERKHTCTVCGFAETQVSLPLGHDFTEGKLVREATIYGEGLYEAVCSRCGAGGSIQSPCSCTDENCGLYFETVPGVFKEGTEITVDKIAEAAAKTEDKKQGILQEWFEGLKDVISYIAGSEDAPAEEPSVIDTALGGVSEEFIVYEIAANINGEEVQPDTEVGDVYVTIPIPESFGRNAAVYQIDSSGNTKDLPVKINYSALAAEGSERNVTAKIDDFSLYALVNLDKVPEKKEVSAADIFKYALELGLFVLFVIFLVLFICKKPSGGKHAK